jgi:hypothetical protein
MAMANKCQFRKEDGKRCRANAQPANGLCVFHDPARASEELSRSVIDSTIAVVEYNKILREEQNEEEPQQYSRHAGRQRRISELERARRPNR